MLLRKEDVLYFFVIPENKEYLVIYNQTSDGWLVIKAPENVKPRYGNSMQNDMYLAYNTFLSNTPLVLLDHFTNTELHGPYILGVSYINKETQDVIFNAIRGDNSKPNEILYLELDEDRNGCLYVEKIDETKTYSFNTKVKECVFRALEIALKDYKQNEGDN